MKIRKRDGTMREVDDDYVLADGEAIMVPLRSWMRWRHDPRRQRPSRRARPGFLFATMKRRSGRRDAYREYAGDSGERWRQGPGQRSSPTRSAPPQTFDSPEAAVAAAYAQYNRDISERWRK